MHQTSAKARIPDIGYAQRVNWVESFLYPI